MLFARSASVPREMFISFRHSSPCVSEMELMDWSIDVSVRIARALELKLDVLPTLHFVCDICACGFVCISMDGRGMGRTSSLGVMSILQDLGNVLCPR